MTFVDKVITCKKKNIKGNILFIHGFCVDHQYFIDMAEKLAEDYNVYLIDLPGHGENKAIRGTKLSIKSLTDYVVQYILAKDLKKLVLIGHSMGGAIASCVTNLLSDRITKLVLVSPYSWAVTALIHNVGFFKAQTIFFPKTMQKKLALAQLLYHNFHALEKNNTWLVACRREFDWLQQNWKTMKRLSRHLTNLCTLNYIKSQQKKVQTQTLLLAGEFDKVCGSTKLLKIFAEYYAPKQAQHMLTTYVFQRSGHICFDEEPAEFYKQVTTFLDTK